MNITILAEPDLEFANGSRRIDPRHGISYYGPADAGTTGPNTIRVGVVGTRDAIQGVKNWLDRSREPIVAKRSHLAHLYLPFPGFDTNVGFRSTIVWNSRLERTIDKRSIKGLKTMNPLEAVHAAVDLYDTELSTLNDEPSCDVVIVCRPDELPEQALPSSEPRQAMGRAALPFRVARAESSPTEIATELLMLTKMNWNATQLDGRVPITLRTADSIGGILKHLTPSDSPQPRYAYYGRRPTPQVRSEDRSPHDPYIDRPALSRLRHSMPGGSYTRSHREGILCQEAFLPSLPFSMHLRTSFEATSIT